MSDLARQQIRPSLSDLRDLPPEYDIVDDDEEDSLHSQEDGEPTHAPAATASRSLPPTIGAEVKPGPSSVLKKDPDNGARKSKTVRIEESPDVQGGRKNPNQARQQRFTIPLEEEDYDEEAPGIDAGGASASFLPLIGTIQERKPVNHSTSASKSDRAGQSRFAARRQLDRDAGIAKPVQQGHPTKKPAQAAKPSVDDEIWLDEDGSPMSAFRKNRLLKQGLRPPSIQAVSKEQPTSSITQISQGNSNAIEGSLEALMKSIAAENEAKIAAMSADEIEHDMQDIKEAFGSNILELLKNRRKKAEEKNHDAAVSTTSIEPKTDALQAETPEEQSPEYIRQKYFPHEPKWMPDALKWTQDQTEDENHPSTFRFDFSGKVIDTSIEDNTTRLAGLHNHGQDQDKPGYTIQELLHLSRSTASSQCIIALQTLGRIAMTYQEVDAGALITDSPNQKISKEVMSTNLRGQACITALWYVEDRRPNVRSAALTCIRECLSSRLGGPGTLPLLVEVPLCRSKPQANTDITQPSEDEGVEEKKKIPTIDDREVLREAVNALLSSLHSPVTTLSEAVHSLQILTQLASRSRDMCKAILQNPSQFLGILHKYLLKQTWSAKEGDVKASILALKLVLCLIAGGRELALILYDGGITSKLIHFIAIPPWSAPTSAQAHSWKHMDLTLRVYDGLGRYGIGANTYSNSHTAFIGVEEWISHFEVEDSPSPLRSLQLQTLQSALRLFSSWTVCATDAHQTHGHHDITWSQVSEWFELSTAMLERFSNIAIEGGDVLTLSAQGDAINLLEVWKAGANANRIEDLRNVKSKEGVIVGEATKFFSNIKASMTVHTDMLLNAMKSRKGEPFWLSQLPVLINISQLCQAANAAVGFTKDSTAISSELLSITALLMREIPWQHLSNQSAIQAGVTEVQRSIVEFIIQAYVNLQAVEAGELQWLQLLTISPPGTEAVVRDALLKYLPVQLGDDGAKELKILSPFLVELLRQKKEENVAPLRPSVDSLKKTTTLFTICYSSIDEEDEEVETDPVSGVPLWKCANSGLPLRKDWPFVAFDDLLHSGNCASLHRPNALSEDWDANELEIVRSSLSLALRLWDSDTQSTSSLPSSSEVYLGIMKVFMLEEETGDTRATGKITGRDLYRDEQVSDSLDKLFKLANILHFNEDSMQSENLENACHRQFGTLLPFYQLFTDLLGLYDGISFGMELFGRAILVPLQMRYAVEYRRLLWIDYAHYLKTITTTAQDAPNGIQAYISEQEVDDSVIRGMSLALLSGHVQKVRNGFLFAVAINQLASLIWTTKDSNPKSNARANQLTKALFRDLQGNNTSEIPYIAEMRQAIVEWEPKGQVLPETEKQERLAFILHNCNQD
ncbi:uncharacterized protein FA14DRAFT_188436 [Meira miltonrushii]|uniref:RNA polymerase II-associated protein 1 C-terminal domain-containing protein n=1 Tax=Meira miltonrushii TaxID=1280837 RepID=A0A316VLK9_9BASI|nr:uncharacterized protein FA14DRAFT_188436 [Meira miltonrushii]PWN38436.1 hypothetical protein FA14DRAFT_188436 [Meira miltonrushii]